MKCQCWVLRFQWLVMVNISSSLVSEGNSIRFWRFFLGSYKPRVRCYDVNELSLKFERCFDNECIKMKILSEDYSKVWMNDYWIVWLGFFDWYRLCLCMRIGILNFILKLEIIIQYEHQDKDEILIIGIHLVIFIVSEQRKKKEMFEDFDKIWGF